MKVIRWSVVCAIGLIALGVAMGSRPPERVISTFAETTEGWSAVPPPDGLALDLALTEGPPSTRSLRASYTMEPRKLAGIKRQVSGAVGTGIRVRLKTSSPTVLVIGCIEKDGSSYMHIVQTVAGQWRAVEAPFATFTLSDDSKDENERLDLDQIGTLVIADAGGFMPTAPTSRTLWVDDVDFGAEVRAQAPKPYQPLLAQGPPSRSGSTVTSGVTYVPGKFDRAMLADSPGELAVTRITDPDRSIDWQWDQGTIEMWLSLTRPIASIGDFTGIAAMQREPFMAGHKGGLMVFVSQGVQIGFMLNGQTDRLVSTGPLAWRPGTWHHLAVTWGPAGMRTYTDGVPRGRNSITAVPALPAPDLVVGGHAWTILANRSACMAIDELRVSSRQRTDAEIAATAGSSAPAAADGDTVALERFDGAPEPPAGLAGGGRPWNTFTPGAPVTLSISPGVAAGTKASVATPLGRKLREVLVETDGRQVRLGAFTTPGFYRVTLGDRGGGWFRVAPARNRTGANLLGASACFAEAQENEEYFRLAQAAGVRMLRMPFEWYEIEPQEGRFVWGKYDRIVQRANRYKVGLIPTFIWEKAQPAWAGPGEVKPGFSSERRPPTDMAKWKRFVRAVVGRYKASVHWWIPANEPNLPRYWHPKPDARAYVALLRATWEAAREADPAAKLLGLSASGIDLRFMEECFKEGALKYCDAVGIHPYICPHSPDETIPVNILDPSSPPGTFRDGLRLAGELIRRHGGKQKLWLDEAGQPYRDDFIAPNWGLPEARAAEVLSKEMVEALASGVVERVLWFSFYGGEYGSFALARPDGSPTFPLAAYCAVGEMLAGASHAGQGTRGRNLQSRVFTAGTRRTEVVWHPTGMARVRPERGERAYDLYGFRMTPAGGFIEVGSAPVYLVR